MNAKRSSVKFIVVSLVAVTALLVGFIGGSAHAGGPLDGMAFVIKGEKGEVLSFENGKFHSTECEKWGFGTGDYTTTSSGDATIFSARTSSAKHGNMVWTGTVTGDRLTGSYTWTKKGWFRTKTKTKEFTGMLKQ